jgi:hypothetical protein
MTLPDSQTYALSIVLQCSPSLIRTSSLSLTSSRSVRMEPGSTRYLWKEQQVEKAIDYVLYGQGEEPPDFSV